MLKNLNPTLLQRFISHTTEKLEPKSVLYVCGCTLPIEEKLPIITLLSPDSDFLQKIANTINLNLPKELAFTITAINENLFAFVLPKGSAANHLQSNTDWFKFDNIFNNLKGKKNLLQHDDVQYHNIVRFYGSSEKPEDQCTTQSFLYEFKISLEQLQNKLDRTVLFIILGEGIEELFLAKPENRPAIKKKLENTAALLPKIVDEGNHDLIGAVNQLSEAIKNLLMVVNDYNAPQESDVEILKELAQAIKTENSEALKHAVAKMPTAESESGHGFFYQAGKDLADKLTDLINSLGSKPKKENCEEDIDCELSIGEGLNTAKKASKKIPPAIQFTFFGHIGNKTNASTYNADITFILQGVTLTSDQLSDLKEGIKLWHEQHNISISLTYQESKLQLSIPTEQKLAEAKVKDKTIIETEKQMATLQLMLTSIKNLPIKGSIIISGENPQLVALAKVIADDLIQKTSKSKEHKIIIQGEMPKPEALIDAQKIYDNLKENSKIKTNSLIFDLNEKKWDNFSINCDNETLNNYITTPAA